MAAGIVGHDLIVYQAAAIGAPAVVTTLTGDTENPSKLFVGRPKQVGLLLDLLAPRQANTESGTVVVAGMGGIGKTALVCHTATLTARRDWFGGGVLFVDLRGYNLDDPVQPGQVYAPMLRVLGVPGEQIPATVDEQATEYHQVLNLLAERGRRVLVVLDNASTSDQVSSLLPRHQAHRALVTTRDTLTLPVAHQLDLDILTTREALQLLTQILVRRQPGDARAARESDSAVRLMTVCGALPLAVEITASILADEPRMTITSLLTELTATDGLGVHRIRHGERALAAIVDLSWQRLRDREPEAARLLPLLTLNPGADLHTDAAAALAGRPAAQVAPWLRVLRQTSLLRYTHGRWSMHDVVRLHVRDHLDNHHKNPATRRLLEHYLQTASAADDHLQALPGDPVPDRFSGRQDALAWFDAEHANLTAAVTFALDISYYDLVVRLAANLSQYLSWRRHMTDLVSVSEHALTAAQRNDTPRVLADAWSYLGRALYEVERFEDAISAYQQDLAIRQEIGDRRGEGKALNNLGLALGQVGRFDEAITAFQQDLAICGEFNNRHGEGKALNNLGLVLRDIGRFDEAITAFQQDLAICQEIGDRYGEGQVQNNLGLALRDIGRFDEAITAEQTAIAIFQETGDRYGEGRALNHLGLVLQDANRLDEAKHAGWRAIAAFRETGDTRAEKIVTNWLNTLPHRRYLDLQRELRNTRTIIIGWTQRLLAWAFATSTSLDSAAPSAKPQPDR